MSTRAPAPASTSRLGPLVTAMLIVVMAALAVVAFSVRHEIYSDEVEHVHAGWLVSQGRRPFTDFFEHHHPLFWYLLGVVLPWTDQSASTLVVLRLWMLVPLAGIALVSYALAAVGSQSRQASWFAAALLLSNSEFVRVACQVRPDVPETACAVASVLVLVRALRACSRLWAGLAGVLMGVAILFSLKAAVAALVALAVLAPSCWRERASRRLAAAFLLGCLVPLTAYAAYLVSTAGLRDYWVANWALNLKATSQKARLRPPQRPIFVNAGFWLAAVFGVLWTGRGRSASAGPRWAALVGGGVLSVLIVTGRTESRSVILALPFLAVAGGAALDDVWRRLRHSPAGASLVLVGLCAAPIVETWRAADTDNTAQLAKVDYVLARTPRGEPVYDANGSFNVFRPDLHYFWFFVGPGRNMPLEAEEGRASRAYLVSRLGPGSYDPCALVSRARPRIVSAHRIDLDACRLRSLYQPTRYPGIFERKD